MVIRLTLFLRPKKPKGAYRSYIYNLTFFLPVVNNLTLRIVSNCVFSSSSLLFFPCQRGLDGARERIKFETAKTLHAHMGCVA
jgi:hypothetical protein